MYIQRRDRFVRFTDQRVAAPAALAVAAPLAAALLPGIAGWAAAGVLALAAAAAWRVDETEFDGVSRTVLHSSWSPFRRRRQEFSFRDIKAVFVESAPANAALRRVALFTDTVRVPLSWKFSPVAHDWEAIADIARRKLGMPTAQSVARQSILNLLSQHPQVPAARATMRRTEAETGPAAFLQRLAA